MEAISGKDHIKIGSAKFATNKENKDETAVYVAINGQLMGKYTFKNPYREHIFAVFHELEYKGYTLSTPFRGYRSRKNIFRGTAF